VEPEASEVVEPPEPTGDQLLAELREYEFELAHPRPRLVRERVPLKLTLDQASLLYEKLRRIVKHTPTPRRPLQVGSAISDPSYLLEILDKHLAQLPATTPVTMSKRNVPRFHKRTLILELRRHERAFFLQIIKNKQRDEWRREAEEEKLFSPLEDAEVAEQEGGREFFYGPSHPEHPGAVFRQELIQKALAELPKKLGMPAVEVTALLAALTEAEGNVSEVARQLGQPQRKTARRLERIVRHLKSRNLSA
jgi:transposase-like protein